MSVVHGTNNDFQVPSLDLRFADRKNFIDTISGEDLITFTRDSVGTYVDENGIIQTAVANEARFDHDPVTGESLGLLVEEARTNSATYSQYPSGKDTQTTAYFQPNVALAPDNTFTALKYVPVNWGYSRNLGALSYSALSNGTIYTATFYAKKAELNYATLNFSFNTVYCIKVDLTTGQVTQTYSLSNPENTSYTVTQCANGWWKISATIKAAVPGGDGIHIGATDSPTGGWQYVQTVFSGANGQSGVYVWGFQIEAGSFPTSYIPTPATFTSRSTTATYYDSNGVVQTAAIDEARDDAYFPDENGVFKPAGLLLEGERTNYALYSDKMDSSVWWNYAYKLSKSYNQAVAPDGTTGATRLSVNTELQQHFLSGNPPSVPSAIYTHSVFAKQGTGSYGIQLKIGSAGGAPYIKFDFSTEQVTTNSGSRARVEKFPNGWYRLSLTSNAASTSAGNFIMMVDENGFDYFTGDGTSSFYVWGYQVEAGTYASSYISTTTDTVTRAADISSSSTVTRAADVASITGSNFSSWYNQSEGTISFKAKSPVSDQFPVVIDDSTNSNRHLFTISNVYQYQIRVSGSTEAQIDGGSILSSFNSIAGGYKTNDIAVSLNGSVNTDSAANVPTCNRLSLYQFSGLTYNGHISRLTYYPTRLSNALLQKLTK